MAVRRRNRLLSDTWCPEILAVLFSSLCSFGILLFLAVFDGKPAFRWHHLTLNAIISVFSTFSRVSLVYAVSSSLGQWKWNFSTEAARPATQFDTIDTASRGVLGALQLLWTLKSRTVVSVGAWVMLVALAMDPFVQQVLTYQDSISYSPDNGTQIAVAARWSGGSETSQSPGGIYGNVDLSVRPVLDISMQSAVLYGFVANTSKVGQQVPVQCASGNCHWASYTSLGMCSRCNDVSDHLRFTRKRGDSLIWVDWPGAEGPEAFGEDVPRYTLRENGLLINNQYDINQTDDPFTLLTAKSTLRPSESITFKNYTTLLVATSIIRMKNLSQVALHFNEKHLEAVECALYFCTKTLTSTTQNGHLIETSEEVASTREPGSWIRMDTGRPAPPQHDNALYEAFHWSPRTDLAIRVPPGSPGADFIPRVNVSQPAIDALSAFVTDSFSISANTFGSNWPTINGAVARNMGNPSDSVRFSSIWATSPIMEAFWASPHLGSTFNNVALSMTNSMRAYSDDSLQVMGDLGKTVSLINVRWEWMILPCACVFLSAVYLGITILNTSRRRVPLWKNSALPILFNPPADRLKDLGDFEPLLSNITNEAKIVSLKLGDDLKIQPCHRMFEATDPSKTEAKTLDLGILRAPAAAMQGYKPIHRSTLSQDEDPGTGGRASSNWSTATLLSPEDGFTKIDKGEENERRHLISENRLEVNLSSPPVQTEKTHFTIPRKPVPRSP